MNRDLEASGASSSYQNENGRLGPSSTGPEAETMRSHYALTKSEAISSLANRLIHSRIYIVFYLAMAGISLVTVALSLKEGCPSTLFFILEAVVNGAMIAEVAIRVVALQKSYWKSVFNIADLVVTAFCIITLAVILSKPCANKGEEVFDTVVLIARNVVQFGRLASIMRKSGTSIFSRPRPIDLSRSNAPDIDMDGDEEAGYEDFNQPLFRRTDVDDDDVLFDAARDNESKSSNTRPRPVSPPTDEDDPWAER